MNPSPQSPGPSRDSLDLNIPDPWALHTASPTFRLCLVATHSLLTHNNQQWVRASEVHELINLLGLTATTVKKQLEIAVAQGVMEKSSGPGSWVRYRFMQGEKAGSLFDVGIFQSQSKEKGE